MGVAGHQSVGGEKLPCTSLSLYIYEYYSPLPLLCFLTVFISIHKIYLFLSILLREQLRDAELPAE